MTSPRHTSAAVSLFGPIVFATYAGIYFWFPKMTGRIDALWAVHDLAVATPRQLPVLAHTRRAAVAGRELVEDRPAAYEPPPTALRPRPVDDGMEAA